MSDLLVDQPIGLGAELVMLAERLEALATHGTGDTVAFSGPRSRGKSALWRSAYVQSAANASLPSPVVVDAERATSRMQDLLGHVESSDQLSAPERQALATHLKTLITDHNFLPFAWHLIAACALDEPRALDALASRADRGAVNTLEGLHELLAEVIECLYATPHILVFENLERLSRASIDWLFSWLTNVHHLRPRPPLLVVLTLTPDATLCHEAARILQTALDHKVLTRYALPALTKAHLTDHVGDLEPTLATEIWKLSAGSAQTFLDIWRELPDSGLIERHEGTWQLSKPDDDGALPSGGIAKQIGMAVSLITAELPSPDLALLALQLAAIQGDTFSIDVVAHGLWRFELRQSENMREHQRRIESLFDRDLHDLVRPLSHRADNDRLGFYRFMSALARHQILLGMDDAARATIAQVAALAVEQVQAAYTGQANWDALALLEPHQALCPRHYSALRDRCLALPSPASRQAELPQIATTMRNLLPPDEWPAWCLDFLRDHRYIYPPDAALPLLDVLVSATPSPSDATRLAALAHRYWLIHAWHEPAPDLDALQDYVRQADALASQATAATADPAATAATADPAATAAAAEARLWCALNVPTDSEPDRLAILQEGIDRLGSDSLSPEHQTLLAQLYISRGFEQQSRQLIDDARASFGGALALLPQADDTESETRRLARSDCLNGLGLVAHLRGELPKAGEYYRRALAAREDLVADRPGYATILNNFGALCHDRMQRDAAEDLLRQALTIRVNILGEHPDCAITLNNLAAQYLDLQQHDMARECATRAMTIQMKRLGEHRDTAYTFYQLGAIFCSQGDLKHATTMAWQALRMLQKCDMESPELPVFLRSYAYVLRRAGRGKEASEWETLADDRDPAPPGTGQMSRKRIAPAALRSTSI